jgi:hypothetical protein
MHDLLFTHSDDPYPFREAVVVAWSDDLYELRLTVERGKLLTGDRVPESRALAALDSLLSQLVGEP